MVSQKYFMSSSAGRLPVLMRMMWGRTRWKCIRISQRAAADSGRETSTSNSRPPA